MCCLNCHQDQLRLVPQLRTDITGTSVCLVLILQWSQLAGPSSLIIQNLCSSKVVPGGKIQGLSSRWAPGWNFKAILEKPKSLHCTQGTASANWSLIYFARNITYWARRAADGPLPMDSVPNELQVGNGLCEQVTCAEPMDTNGQLLEAGDIQAQALFEQAEPSAPSMPGFQLREPAGLFKDLGIKWDEMPEVLSMQDDDSPFIWPWRNRCSINY